MFTHKPSSLENENKVELKENKDTYTSDLVNSFIDQLVKIIHAVKIQKKLERYNVYLTSEVYIRENKEDIIRDCQEYFFSVKDVSKKELFLLDVCQLLRHINTMLSNRVQKQKSSEEKKSESNDSTLIEQTCLETQAVIKRIRTSLLTIYKALISTYHYSKDPNKSPMEIIGNWAFFSSIKNVLYNPCLVSSSMDYAVETLAKNWEAVEKLSPIQLNLSSDFFEQQAATTTVEKRKNNLKGMRDIIEMAKIGHFNHFNYETKNRMKC